MKVKPANRVDEVKREREIAYVRKRKDGRRRKEEKRKKREGGREEHTTSWERNFLMIVGVGSSMGKMFSVHTQEKKEADQGEGGQRGDWLRRREAQILKKKNRPRTIPCQRIYEPLQRFT